MTKNNNKQSKKQQNRRYQNKLESKRDLVQKDASQGQEYAQIQSKLGDCRFKLTCYDGIERIARLCGGMRYNMRKKARLDVGNIVLISIRDFDEAKADIIHKYTDEEARKLLNLGAIPATARVSALPVELAMSEILPELLEKSSLDDMFEFIWQIGLDEDYVRDK